MFACVCTPLKILEIIKILIGGKTAPFLVFYFSFKKVTKTESKLIKAITDVCVYPLKSGGKRNFACFPVTAYKCAEQCTVCYVTTNATFKMVGEYTLKKVLHLTEVTVCCFALQKNACKLGCARKNT